MNRVNRKRTKLYIGILWVFLSIVILLAFPAARKGPLGFGPPAPTTVFQSRDGSYSFSYPANWVASELPDGNHGDHEVIAIILVSGRESANVTIARKNFPNDAGSEVFAWGVSRAENHPNYTNISTLSRRDKIGVNKLINDYTWSSSSMDSSSKIRCHDYYLLTNNIGYSISYCAKEKDWSALQNTFTKMQESFSASGEMEW